MRFVGIVVISIIESFKRLINTDAINIENSRFCFCTARRFQCNFVFSSIHTGHGDDRHLIQVAALALRDHRELLDDSISSITVLAFHLHRDNGVLILRGAADDLEARSTEIKAHHVCGFLDHQRTK